MKKIVYTRHGGGVSVHTPTAECVAYLCSGGRWPDVGRGFLDTQIERQVARGISSSVARRFVHGMQFGGLTTAEALEVIRDRDCSPHGTACELWDEDEVPSDRWFRDAWSRSQNGGPIVVDMRKARKIQAAQIEIVRQGLLRELPVLSAAADTDAEALRISQRLDLISGFSSRSFLRVTDEPDHLKSMWPDVLGPRPDKPVIPANLFGASN